MTPDQRDKLVLICVRSSMGQTPTLEENIFLRKMHKEYPKEYPTSEEIRDIVVPSINPLFKPSGKAWNYETKKYE